MFICKWEPMNEHGEVTGYIDFISYFVGIMTGIMVGIFIGHILL